MCPVTLFRVGIVVRRAGACAHAALPCLDVLYILPGCLSVELLEHTRDRQGDNHVDDLHMLGNRRGRAA